MQYNTIHKYNTMHNVPLLQTLSIAFVRNHRLPHLHNYFIYHPCLYCQMQLMTGNLISLKYLTSESMKKCPWSLYIWQEGVENVNRFRFFYLMKLCFTWSGSLKIPSNPVTINLT